KPLLRIYLIQIRLYWYRVGLRLCLRPTAGVQSECGGRGCGYQRQLAQGPGKAKLLPHHG
ncbi:MAG TPA: hypothetical protein VGR19_02325, partial [Allosphingosinicella sp.]|nr:hypothetical protein [Allosphingosinicella sp.]